MPGVRAIAFDAYGTLSDVHSMVAACREVTGEPGSPDVRDPREYGGLRFVKLL